MRFILLLFILTPIVEIGLFIEVGGLIGLWPTLGLVVATAVIGTTLLRRQGLATMLSARESLAHGEFPVNEVFDGACLLASGLLLLTPGFVTDFVGALLLTPIFRAAIRRPILRRLMSRTGGWPSRAAPGDDSMIDGEFQEIWPTDQDKNENGPPESLDPPHKRG